MTAESRRRPSIAFFDYPDVFEDFYPNYGVDQRSFGSCWTAAGNHAFLSVLQRAVGDVVWYAFSLDPEFAESRHDVVGCRIRMLRSSWLHRSLWRWFYLSRHSWRWRRRLYPAYAAVASYVSLLSWQFFAALGRDRPDVLFVQDYASGRFDVLLVVARLLGIRLIAFHTGSDPATYVGGALKRWSIRRADCLIASSEAERDRLATDYHVAPDRLKIILTPIDVACYRPADRTESCRAAGLDPSRRYVLFVGRLDDEVKRVGALIRAFARVAHGHGDADLLIAGDGPDRARIQAEALALAPGRVKFLGWVADPGGRAFLYNAAECLVLASRSEGFPTVVGEAMACGTPVIAPRIGGIGELVVPERTGYLFAPGNDEALAVLLDAALARRDRLAAMRPRARDVAIQRVSPDVVAAQLRDCFLPGALRG